jgi:hypothetical protein
MTKKRKRPPGAAPEAARAPKRHAREQEVIRRLQRELSGALVRGAALFRALEQTTRERDTLRARLAAVLLSSRTEHWGGALHPERCY